jgi:hypothetical protein
LSFCAFVCTGPCEAFGGWNFDAVAEAGLGLACLDVLWRYCRSSDNDMAPLTGCGEWRGESPRGEFVRCVPKVGALCELRAEAPGVVGPFGAVNGPVCVGVIALVVAAMAATE